MGWWRRADEAGFPRRRNRLRYPGYDYAQPGAVFVTICTYGRQSLLGEIRDGQIHPSTFGELVLAAWERLPGKYPEIGLDTMVVMPDHLHAIVYTGMDPTRDRQSATVGDVVRWFKNVTVRGYGDHVRHHGWEPYDRHLWQDKFYDHIVRTARDMSLIREYIERNPERWQDQVEDWGLPPFDQG